MGSKNGPQPSVEREEGGALGMERGEKPNFHTGEPVRRRHIPLAFGFKRESGQIL